MITLQLTEAEVRYITVGRVSTEIRNKALAALPPVYPEGTIAWVTLHSLEEIYLAVRVDGGWARVKSGAREWHDVSVTSVEVIPTLPEGHISIPRSVAENLRSAEGWRIMARSSNGVGDAFYSAIADALEGKVLR